MVTVATEISRALDAAVEQAQERLRLYTRSACFKMDLGVREIRMLSALPWEQRWPLQASEMHTFALLLEKGLLTHTYGQPPELSEAGRLVRQLLVESQHIVPPPTPLTPDVLLATLMGAVNAYCLDALVQQQRAVVRVINGAPHLVVQMRTSAGTAEWAVPSSAFRRIG